MKIESLSVRQGMQEKSFRFKDGLNLICSNGRNQVGKTTLVRFLLHSLGEAIPNTQKLRMEKCATRLAVVKDDGATLFVFREGRAMRIVYPVSEETWNYSLPFEAREAKAKIYGVNAPDLLDNLLGAFYIDQDKGWTLLNRGKVIGGVEFSVGGLLRGLSGKDCNGLELHLKQLKKDIKKYEFITDAAGYQNELVNDPGFGELSYDAARDQSRLEQLRMRDASIGKRLSDVRRAQKDNKRFVDHVSQLGLRVKTPDGSEIRVTADNIADFQDANNYLEGEASALSAEREEVKERIREIEASLQGSAMLFHVEGAAMVFDRQIAAMKLDLGSCEAVLKGLKKERAEVDAQLEAAASTNNRAYEVMSQYALEYSRALGVEQLFLGSPEGVLTRRVKDKSGTGYHLLVFAFRMAFASTVREVAGIRLPLVIDSIRDGEMSAANFQKCLDLLRDKMSDHQQIVASIDATGFDADNVIEIENALMENSSMVVDLREWERGG